MIMDEGYYRRSEEFGVPYLEHTFNTKIDLSSREMDLAGVDLISADGSIIFYVRCRLNGYRDLTFNGQQALAKLSANAKKYPKFYALLQYGSADPTLGFKDPNFKIYNQIVVDLGRFVSEKEALGLPLDQFMSKEPQKVGESVKHFLLWRGWPSYVVAMDTSPLEDTQPVAK